MLHGARQPPLSLRAPGPVIPGWAAVAEAVSLLRTELRFAPRGLVECLSCHAEGEGPAVPATRELPDKPAERRVAIDRRQRHAPSTGRTRAPVPDRRRGAPRSAAIRDGRAATPRFASVCAMTRRPCPLRSSPTWTICSASAASSRYPRASKPIDDIVRRRCVESSGARHATRLGDRQRPHAQLLQQRFSASSDNCSVVGRRRPASRR